MSFLETLQERARARGAVLVFPEGGDARIQSAAAELSEQELARPILLGDPAVVESGLPGARERIRIVHPTRDPEAGRYEEAYRATSRDSRASPERVRAAARDPLTRAALMVALGEADGMVAGAVHTTAAVVRACIRCVGPAPGLHTVSSSFYMVVPPFRLGHEEVLTFTDAGVIPEPDPGQLAEIAISAADARRHVVGDEPSVAFLSYSTLGSAEGGSVDRIREAVDLVRDRRPELRVDGELQADAALIAGVARTKAPESNVAGRANVLVFPSLDAGNIAYKLVQRLARATALGPILQGLARPCNDLSRGASAHDIRDVACITAVQSA